MNAPIRPPVASTEERRSAAPPPGLPAATFVHLKVHSAYSLLEGALQISKLGKLAEGAGMPAIALTDTNNMFGVLEFAEKVGKDGIQPIVGVSLAIDCGDKGRDDAFKKPALPTRHRDGLVALYAMNETGYANLMKLVSKAHLEASDVEGPHITIAALAQHAAGLIVLTGGPDGPIDRALRDMQAGLAKARLEKLKAIARRPALCRTPAARIVSRGRGRAATRRSRLRSGVAAGRDQRVLFRKARRL